MRLHKYMFADSKSPDILSRNINNASEAYDTRMKIL